MTERIRVALLDANGGGYSRELATTLDGAELIVARPVAPAEALLRRRGLVPGLTQVPGALRALTRGAFHVVHAFTPLDAVAALALRRTAGCAVVFTFTEAVRRETLADRRLRLRSLERVLEHADALIAADDEVRAGTERWLALCPPVLAAGDAAGHERIYRRSLGRSG